MTLKLQYISRIAIGGLFCVLISACSKENLKDPADNRATGQPETEKTKYTIGLDKKEANVFELIKISILRNGDSTFLYNSFPFGTLAAMAEMDSVILNIPGLLKQISTPNHFTFSSSHVFPMPGNYAVYLHAYKNGKVVSADTTGITIKNDNDFLGVNWKTSEASAYGVMFEPEDDYKLFLRYNGTTAFLIYYPHNFDKISPEKLFLKSKKILIEYMSKLYGKPQYRYEGSNIEATDLKPLFTALFQYKNPEDFPTAIWQTPTANIALLSTSSIYKVPNIVIAEPAAKP